jgi:hypothetical protein
LTKPRGVNLELTIVRRDPPIKLNDLIKSVQHRTRSCTELERLAMAAEYGELLKAMGDDLVSHFVEQARGAGASWAQVGEQLGCYEAGRLSALLHQAADLPLRP